MQLKTAGLVLKEVALKEKDKYITLLTPNNGKIEVFCRGVMMKKGQNLIGSRLMSYSDFVLFEKGGKYTLNSVEMNTVFTGIEQNLDKLFLAQYIIEFLYFVTDQEMIGSELLRLALNSLYILSKTEKSPDLIKAIFELKAIEICGFTPLILNCCICGAKSYSKSENMLFSVSEGCISCEDCNQKGSYMSKSVFSAMNFIFSQPMEKIFSFNIGNKNLVELGSVAEQYTLYHINHEFKTLKYIHEN